LSETSGLTAFTTNAVTTKLTGVELSLMGTPVQTQSGFRWDVLVNWSTYKEIFEDLPSNFENYQFHRETGSINFLPVLPPKLLMDR